MKTLRYKSMFRVLLIGIILPFIFTGQAVAMDLTGTGRDYTAQPRETKEVPLETLIIPNDKPVKITSTTILENNQRYIIEASGVISDWSHVRDGVDAVWCYAEWRCGKQGEAWNQLHIDGKGMTDIAGKPIPYNPQHIYKVQYQGQGKQVELYCTDAQGSWGDNSGSFTVKIFKKEGDYVPEPGGGRDYTLQPRKEGRDYTSQPRENKVEDTFKKVKGFFGW